MVYGEMIFFCDLCVSTSTKLCDTLHYSKWAYTRIYRGFTGQGRILSIFTGNRLEVSKICAFLSPFHLHKFKARSHLVLRFS